LENYKKNYNKPSLSMYIIAKNANPRGRFSTNKLLFRVYLNMRIITKFKLSRLHKEFYCIY